MRCRCWEVTPVGPFHQWPTGFGLRILLRFRRRRGQPVLPRSLRGHHGGRAAEVARGGLHADRGSRRPRDHLGAPAEGAVARQAVLHVLRARGHPRPTSGAQGVVRQVQGQVRRRLGRASREDITRQKKLGVVPKDAELTERHDEIPAWDDMPAELNRCWPARWRSTPASWSRPTTRWAASSMRSTTSASSTTP